MAGRRLGPGAVRPETVRSSLWSGVLVDPTSGPSCLNLLIIRRVLLAIERRRTGGRNCELLGHCKRDNQIPIAVANREERQEESESHTPGPLPPGGGTIASEPSLARAARIWVATNSPQYDASSLVRTNQGFQQESRRESASKLDALAGNKFTSAHVWGRCTGSRWGRDALAGTSALHQ